MLEPINKMIKDPIHGFINFNGEVENGLKELLSDPFFQRLRRVKQLGFSDYVFPSATHSRFAHSLGVYSIAKRLLSIVEPDRKPGDWSQGGQACLAAALLHDVGHGMFSHAFEKAMSFFFARNPNQAERQGSLKDAVDHEKVSPQIIMNSSVTRFLERIGGNGFPIEVANIIKKANKKCIYTSIVTSQLDADRLDYATRDPYFAGVSSGRVDLDWLIRNMKVGEQDESRFLYVNSKAYVSLEQFTVTLFHLYPTIYLHKKARGLEYMFALLMSRIFELIADDSYKAAGLSKGHPFVRFFNEPDNLEHALRLDDTLFWGSLYLLRDASDLVVRDVATQLGNRKIRPMLDVWKLADEIVADRKDLLRLSALERVQMVDEICGEVCKEIQSDGDLWTNDCYYDTYDRPIYKPMHVVGGHPQQINVSAGGKVLDIASISPLVASSAAFNIHRIYYDGQSYKKPERLKSSLGERLGKKVGAFRAREPQEQHA